MSSRPIADYAVLADGHTAALVSSLGSIDWLCRPAFDSPSLFGRLLDADAGHWSITPDGVTRVSRRYLTDSMALRTEFVCTTGTVELCDAQLLRGGEASTSPQALARIVTCLDGEAKVDIVFKPRPEYGLVHPILTPIPGGVSAVGGPLRVTLTTPVEMLIGHDGATATARLRAGDRLCFLTQAVRLSDPDPLPWPSDAIEEAFDETVTAWTEWNQRHHLQLGEHDDLVRRSRMVLESLRYQPTGAIVAAPTTSLPEEVGGVRNWDYRYSWLRDASFTVQALATSGCQREALAYFDYLTHTAAHYHATNPLQIMFGIRGHHDLSERHLDHLSGWRDSRPVRVGNGAWRQPQLDVYGELLNAAWQVRDHLASLSPATTRLLCQIADAAAEQWGTTDNGIWEVRGQPRHFTYSKVMCWVALDRAIKLAPVLGSDEHVDHWATERERIRDAVENRSWNPNIAAFTAGFDSEDLDASVLTLPLVGFLPGGDSRIVSTVDAIAEHLTDRRGLTLRYRISGQDGVAGGEGSFLLCTFWLVEALTATGQRRRAERLFQKACGYVNDVGLLSEEVDGATGELLGNFPQAFSHIGLINAATALFHAEDELSGADLSFAVPLLLTRRRLTAHRRPLAALTTPHRPCRTHRSV
ncbi:glycoside hydrolase family 15 protein [Haloglycomyces albus]|uniref:glycoside hydrolase family 15 protein n=1 Tax=Haloglycomyces albus TaxID=526067 RepID=UPI00046CEE68|nr:glycoside hydrolase family 15 protein [Haloglycomyces albus]